MNSGELEKEIGRGKGLLTEMVGETSDFLERFDALEATEIRDFDRKRQRLLETLVRFHSGLMRQLSEVKTGLPPVMTKQLEEFRMFKEEFVHKIMETDAAIIARANQSLDSLQGELAAIGRGKLALRGYTRKRGISPKCLDKTG
ncbi:MAG TPA: flagellar protein FliT [Geobacteraceae bacterium]|nr:flagellar protein FliT [Geobacteraceae bacterium]